MISTELPLISHPGDFINDDVGIGEIAMLKSTPSKAHFTWLSHYPTENGLFLLDNTWYVMSGEYRSFPIMSVPKDSEVIIHIHNGFFIEIFFYYPSISDFIHTPNSNTRHFVASQFGIIRYWPVEVSKQEYVRLRSLGSSPMYRDDVFYYFRVLEDNRLRWKAYLWNEISEDALGHILLEWT